MGFVLSLFGSLLIGGGVANADNPRATPGPQIPGAVNTNDAWWAVDGSINKLRFRDIREGFTPCSPFQPATGENYGTGTVRITNAGPNDRGYGAILVRGSLSGLEPGSYQLVVAKLTRDGSIITGCPGTTQGTRFVVGNGNAVPQATPLTNQRFAVAPDYGNGVYIALVIKTGQSRDKAVLMSEPFHVRLFNVSGSGH